jgi:MFS family permease
LLIANCKLLIKSAVSNLQSAMLRIPRPVWLLGWVSLATDAASEAIYALLPFFLTQVLGATAVSLGIVEGAAEAANSLLKIISGRIADRSRGKRWLVLLGYGVSSFVRPLIAITTTWTQVFTVRVIDRVGKGVRGAPRDAMLAAWATSTTRGKVYGFHRGMDHLGAVVGPVLATLFLVFYPGEYRTLFALTVIPGVIAVVLIFFVPDEKVRLKADPTEGAVGISWTNEASTSVGSSTSVVSSTSVGSGFSSAEASAEAVSRTDEPLPRRFHLFIGVIALFMLGNSSDAFLLLRLTDAAGSARYVPLMWSALHVVKATVSLIAGSWSDRIGRRTVITIGWLVYAVVYGGFAVSTALPALLGWFLIYGFYFGFAEGTEKALVADLAPASRRGAAFGVYNAVQGIGALAASVLFGVIWKVYGAPVAFAVGAALALLATALLFIVVPARATDS